MEDGFVSTLHLESSTLSVLHHKNNNNNTLQIDHHGEQWLSPGRRSQEPGQEEILCNEAAVKEKLFFNEPHYRNTLHASNCYLLTGLFLSSFQAS